MRAFMCECVRVGACVRARVCVFACVCVFPRARVCVFARVCIRVHVCMCMRARAWVCRGVGGEGGCERGARDVVENRHTFYCVNFAASVLLRQFLREMSKALPVSVALWHAYVR